MLAFAFVLSLLLPSPAAAGASLPSGFLDYRLAVERYRACGDGGRALVAAFSADRLRELIGAIRREDPEHPASPSPESWPPALIAAGAVMHTHAALKVRGEDRAAQIAAARHLLAQLAREDPESAIVLPWHTTIAALLQGTGELLGLLDHLRRVPRAYHGDPAFLLAQALADEMVASPLPGPEVRLEIARGLDTFPEWISAQRRLYRDRAIAGFGRVLERDPDNAEAAVRLGFLLAGDGRLEDAEPPLLVARTHADRPVLRYYAALLAGRLHERRGEFALAEREFRAAAALAPHGQAPAVALARVLVLRGRRAEAVKVAEELLARPTGKDAPPGDPWLLYPFGRFWAFDELMDGLRAAVQQCR